MSNLGLNCNDLFQNIILSLFHPIGITPFEVHNVLFHEEFMLKSTLSRILLEGEKLEFVKTSVSWIAGKNTMDSCFILNFGYSAPLPWPQVSI